ncbi:hypothetical protein WIS52_30190 [Pseudonocardia nematodicida]|uniref:Uncharacterized protein n=1 Tax=Pseudonocardia nematodicida TaxID=1206997 RepID=A0ABV1KK58_9PSEU
MSGVVAVVAWAALAGWITAGVLLVLAHRRLERLERAQTLRKWEIVTLRADLGRLLRGAGHADGVATGPVPDGCGAEGDAAGPPDLPEAPESPHGNGAVGPVGHGAVGPVGHGAAGPFGNGVVGPDDPEAPEGHGPVPVGSKQAPDASAGRGDPIAAAVPAEDAGPGAVRRAVGPSAWRRARRGVVRRRRRRTY